jgi:hypothetical protein
MTIAGMAVVIVRLWREVGPLRSEVVQLRNETGRLSVDDPTRIHAIEVRTNDDFLFKWRVWVPLGQTLRVRYRWDNLRRAGESRRSNSVVVLEPGEQWITFTVRPTRGDSCDAKLTTERRSSGMYNIPITRQWWKRAQSARADGVGFTCRIVEENDEGRFVLKHIVAEAVDNSSSLIGKNYSSGFMIWLESAKSPR